MYEPYSCIKRKKKLTVTSSESKGITRLCTLRAQAKKNVTPQNDMHPLIKSRTFIHRGLFDNRLSLLLCDTALAPTSAGGDLYLDPVILHIRDGGRRSDLTGRRRGRLRRILVLLLTLSRSLAKMFEVTLRRNGTGQKFALLLRDRQRGRRGLLLDMMLLF